MPLGTIPNFGTSGGVGPYANTNVGVMPNYFSAGPSGKGKNWYKKWIKQMGGRGRYGGGREAFDLALEFAKGGGKKNSFLSSSTNPMMTAAYNAGKDYMRATGQRESSAGGNAQAGLLATLAAGRAGSAANSASLEWLNGLRGVADIESVRLGQELGEEGNYRDYFLNKGQARTNAWLQNKALDQRNTLSIGTGPSYASSGQMKTNPNPNLSTMNTTSTSIPGPRGSGPGTDTNANGDLVPGGTGDSSGGGAPSGGTGGGSGNRPAQNISTAGVDPLAAFKAQLKNQRGMYPKPNMGRTV